MFSTVQRATARLSTVASRSLNVGVIGAGRIGRTHLDTLASIPGVQPVIISDVVEPVLKDVTAQYGVPRYTLDGNEVINDPEVEAVWICSPSQFHADQIKACAAAGKHIFCEKPIATDLAGTIEAIQVAKDAGVKLMTAFQRRYDPNFAALRKALEAGEIGMPVNAILLSRDPAPPPFQYVAGGGGLFKDMAIHDLDIARWVMSARGPNEVVRVYATGFCSVDPEIKQLSESNPSEAIDTASIQLLFESGAAATINVCRRASYGYDQRVEVLGEKGTLRFENVHPTTVEKWTGDSVSRLDLPHDFFMTRYAQAYVNETRAFCEALSQNKPVTPDGDDGKKALMLAMACDKSLREARPVDLSEIAP